MTWGDLLKLYKPQFLIFKTDKTIVSTPEDHCVWGFNEIMHVQNLGQYLALVDG